MPTIFYVIWGIEVLALLSMLAYLRGHRSRAGVILAMILAVAVLSETLSLYQLCPRPYQDLKRDITIFMQWAGYLFLFQMLLSGNKRKIARALLAFYTLVTLGFVIAGKLYGVDHFFIPYAVGALTILVAVLLFFHHDLVHQQNEGSFISRFYPLIFAGLFVWIAAEIPLMTSIEYMNKNGLQEKLLPFINTKIYASAIYYLSYPLALLWSMKRS